MTEPQSLNPVGVVGAGVMGRGIAQILIQSGHDVWLHDAFAGAAEKAQASLAQQLGRLVEKGKLAAEKRDAALARLHLAAALADLAPCRLVIEAIVENLDAKVALFRELEGIVADDAILATNTSSLSVTQLAAACRRPERVAGLHFFNPVPLMKVAEVIGGARTEPALLDALAALVEKAGHAAVRAGDTPGFIVNHLGRAYSTEALRIVGEGIAGYAEVDDVMREAAGFKLGPFELLDLTALDVSHPVMESIYEQYYHEPRYRPSALARQRMTAGLLGRKTGAGFYGYGADGAKVAPETEPGEDLSQAELPHIWVGGGEAADVTKLKEVVASLGGVVESGDHPSDGCLILVCPLGWDATTTAIDHHLDASRTVAIDPLHGFAAFSGRRTLMVTPATTEEALRAARALFGRDGVPVTTINDSPGFLAQRILASIVNLGADIVQQRVCSPQDLDTAVRLALAYPKGPLALGDSLGAARVLTILERMENFYGDPRYRPSPWLKRRAKLGLSLTVPDRLGFGG